MFLVILIVWQPEVLRGQMGNRMNGSTLRRESGDVSHSGEDCKGENSGWLAVNGKETLVGLDTAQMYGP